MISCIVIVLSAIVLSALFSGLETGAYTLNRVRLLHNVQSELSRASLLSRNINDSQQFIFMTLVGNNIAVYFATGAVTDYFYHSGLAGDELEMIYGIIPWSAEIAATAVLMLPLFIFAEVGPKNLFRVKSDPLMYQTAGIQCLFLTLFKPLTHPMKRIAEFFTRSGSCDYSHGMRNITLQRLRFFLKESRDEGTINERQSRMIDNTLMLQQKMVTDAMIPLTSLIALEQHDVTIDKCSTIFMKHSINTIPVYDGSISQIHSYVDVADFILTVIENKKLADLEMREMFWIYAQNDLQQAFYQMQSNGAAIAAVKGSHDNVIGMVRLKDIVQTITGSR